MRKAAATSIALAFILSACGGGGGAGEQPALQPVNPKAVYPVPVLRPCETSGPTAPPCSASQAAGVR